MILLCSGSGASTMNWSVPGSQMRIRPGLLAAQMIEGHVARKEAFLLEVDGEPVSLCTHTAQVSDIVQIGGVWTPPEWRGRGYARRVVAGALQVAEQEGVTRAVLFTEGRAARRCYEALGFQRVGDYGTIIFVSDPAS